MTTQDVTLLLAMLAVVAETAVAVAVVVTLGGRWSDRLAGWRDLLLERFGPVALQLALGVAVVATLGSLYLSEVAHFVPCRLCWYQRIAMYPLVPILGVAVWRGDPDVRFYALPLATIGGLIATYHVVLERYPSLESGVCEKTNPCTLIWVRRFGYLTIPAMALSAFAFVAVLLLTAHAHRRAEEDTDTGAGDAPTLPDELEVA